MANTTIYLRVSMLVCVLLVISTTPAHAYLGPGAALSAIGSFLALLAVIALAILGFLWFPIKRLLSKRKRNQSKSEVTPELDPALANKSIESQNGPVPPTGSEEHK